MENTMPISLLNDYIFCPASIYFHMIDADTDKLAYASDEQLQGSVLHEKTDTDTYSTSADVLQGISVYCEQYGLEGKIDIFKKSSGILIERKRKISTVYDGQIFQLFAYCFALREMGFIVKKLNIHSMLDNKNYPILLPENNTVLLQRFKKTIYDIQSFSFNTFKQENKTKCEKCVYSPLCSYSLYKEGEK